MYNGIDNTVLNYGNAVNMDKYLIFVNMHTHTSACEMKGLCTRSEIYSLIPRPPHPSLCCLHKRWGEKAWERGYKIWFWGYDSSSRRSWMRETKAAEKEHHEGENEELMTVQGSAGELGA